MTACFKRFSSLCGNKRRSWDAYECITDRAGAGNGCARPPAPPPIACALERDAYTDNLTGLGNRMGYGHAVDELWDAQAPFTVALVDLDNLKYANDAFGHDEGNHYILTVAELLRACCREGDGSGAYRIGGDEFVLISPRDTESSLASRLEKARDELVEKSAATEPMTFSFSYGCSKVHPDEGGSRKDITADADRKMYRYKLAHRSAQQRMRNVPGAAAARGGDFNARFFTERVFEALAMAVPGRYQFVIDIESDRSRWSANAVTDLGIPSANLENTTKVWGEHVHADDLSAYLEGDRALSLLSARLLSVLRGRGLAYRTRGSEFVALVRGGCERDVVELRQEVSAQLAKPIRFEGEELPVSMRYAVVFLDLVDRQPLPILNDLDQRLREGASTLGRAGDGQGDGREGSQAGDAHAPSRRGVGLGQARTAGEKRLDPLTGLLCSSDFIETAREWCRANPAEQWAFVTLDIDNLPIFYEWHGKEEGKLLVSEVAGVLRGMQGESKLCAGYWGEDDFSLLVALDQGLLVAGAEKDGRRAGIADPLLSLAREAGVSVIADDVQTERQVDALRGSGIRYIQGYVYYLPMSPADLESLLANTLLVERAGIVALGEQGAKEPPAKDDAFRKGFFAR